MNLYHNPKRYPNHKRLP